MFKIELTAQFRCAGSDSYISWLDYVLSLGGEHDLSWKDFNEYEFKIFNSPEELEREIMAKARRGYSARIVAGFCWKWSDPKPDGTLIKDVKIGSWERPWNRKDNGRTPAEYHPYTLWATTDEGLSQIGCIYSAQGFEFDYCGVIVGNDLAWNPALGGWRGIKENSYDPVLKRSGEKFTRLVLNTYRVLLSRGMKGTYVYFMDKSVQKRFEELLY